MADEYERSFDCDGCEVNFTDERAAGFAGDALGRDASTEEFLVICDDQQKFAAWVVDRRSVRYRCYLHDDDFGQGGF